MICPRDSNTLTVTYKHGIEVDICPSCDGVWLDRGELDKILKLGGGKLNASSQSGSTASNPSVMGFSSGTGPSATQSSGDSSGIFDIFLDLFN